MTKDDPQVIKKKEANSTGLILPGQALPGKLLILPVYERPFFPAQIQPLVVDRDHWQSTFDHLRETKQHIVGLVHVCLLYTSPSPRDLSTSRMPSSA